MKLSSYKYLKKIDIAIISLFTLLFLYIYTGFYYPDNYILSYGSNPNKILWAIRILLPFLFLGIVILYINVRSRKIEKSSLIVLIISTLLTLYIFYTIADMLYQQWFDNNRKEFHPYLQIKPIDYSPSNNLNSVKVFFLGGSTTELTDKSGVDWPSKVESILHEQYNMRNIEIHNLGRQWYTSLHTLINFETNLRKHHPSVIIIMQSVNDLLHNADFSYFSRGNFRNDYGHFYGPLNRIIDRRSLWRYISDIISGLWYSKPRRIITTDDFPGLEAYKRNINNIIEMAKHDSTEVVLLSEPHLFKKNMTNEEINSIGMLKIEAINDTMVWSIETALNGMIQYNDALKSIAKEKNLPFIDLEKEIPKTLTFFYDEVHYQDTTFSIIAPFIAKELYKILSAKNIE